MEMTPEKKKTLLYVGGAVASIAALVLYMKSKSAANSNVGYGGMPVSGAGTGGGSSSDTAAIQAATQATIAQSQEQTQISLAQMNNATAVQVATIQAGAIASANRAKSLTAAVSPGGALTAAAPDVAKGVTGLLGNLFDTIKGLVTPATSNPSPTTNANGLPYYLAAPDATDNYGFGDFTSYVAPATYNEGGNIIDLTTQGGVSTGATFFQGSIGSGDSGYTGGIPSETYTNPPDINPFGAGVFV